MLLAFHVAGKVYVYVFEKLWLALTIVGLLASPQLSADNKALDTSLCT